MTNTARFLTAERNDLMDLSKRLFGSIDDSFLQDPAKPLIVSVNGSLRSGKKIIPDLARVALLEQKCKNHNGSYNHDEYWIGRKNGQPVEIDFINIQGWPFARDLQKNDLDTPRHECHRNTFHAFLKQRKNGGISFIHNYTDFDMPPDIDIYVETTLLNKVRTDDQGRLHNYPELQLIFKQMAGDRDRFDEAEEMGVRFVEITVNNQALLQSTGFQEMFKLLIPSSTQRPIYRAAPTAFAPAQKMV